MPSVLENTGLQLHINGSQMPAYTIINSLVQTTADSLNNTPNVSNDMGKSRMEEFSLAYRPIHGMLAPVICVLGTIANCLNIVVLTRKNMLSPTNILLTWLAISDGLTMMAYLPFIILNYHIYMSDVPSPYANARYIMFFAIFSVIVHSISIWLTVSLAVFRYIFIRYPRRGAKLCSIYRARLTVLIVCVVVTIVCIPNSISYTFKSKNIKNDTSWFIDVKSATADEKLLKNCNLWIQAFLVKLIPCFLLTVLSMLLIKQMKDAERRRKKLFTNCNGKTEDDSCRHRKTNRTTRMLVVVVVLFVITETPQGILHLVGGVIEDFFSNVYVPLGDLMDTLALFNNGINFVLYCTMSKQFRETFIKTFLSDVVTTGNSRMIETKVVTYPTQRVSEV